MGFTLQDFEDAAARKYAGLTIEDGPTGPIVIRSVVRLSDQETERLDAAQTKLKGIQDEEGGKPSDVRNALVGILCILADKPADLKKYTARLDLGVITSIYEEFVNQTKAPEGN